MFLVAILACLIALATVGTGCGLFIVVGYMVRSAYHPELPGDMYEDDEDDLDPAPDVMELHPRHLGKLCRDCDNIATHYNKTDDEYFCPDHEPTCLIEAFSYQIEWDLPAYLNAWRSQLMD